MKKAFLSLMALSACATYQPKESQKVVDLPQSAVASPKAHLVEVHGHRGARAKRPENTLPAFEYALGLGVDYLELDLQVTKDEVLVVGHDFVLNPEICRDAAGAPARNIVVHHTSLEQLKAYECGAVKNPNFPLQVTSAGVKIPTLDEVFEMVKKSKAPAAKTVHFNIETKMSQRKGYSPTPSRFAHLLMEVLKKHKMLERTIVQSFDFRTLMEVRILEPNIRISALFNDYQDFGGIAQGLKTNVISPRFQLLDSGKVERLHALGVAVVPWTLNSPKDWAKALKYKVDGIITDDPEGLIEFLAKQSQAKVAL